ncbi:MAG: DivIVA domain-containing protein [Acidobacteria bacterium]|nr:DivIVA domain-containing protein [Acidobacteriota bacterium]
MSIMPLEMRQKQFPRTFRGFEPDTVTAFLAEAADDYEQARREIDQLRQDVVRMEQLLGEHRERETTLRNTLLTAQRVADEIREAAQQEARLIVREAEGRAQMLVDKAQLRCDDVERELTELRLRRRDAELSLDASIASLQHALDFIRAQEKVVREDKPVVRLRAVEPVSSVVDEMDDDGHGRAQAQS